MVREVSAGGVVVRPGDGGWSVAVIEPQWEEPPSTGSAKKKSQKVRLALPKGLVDPGEKPQETALREVFEETGLTASPIAKVADIKYFYVRSWGDKQRVFKIVSFYLLRYQSGEINQISEDMRIEVKRAFWMPLEEAGEKLSYKGEREIVGRARVYLSENAEI